MLLLDAGKVCYLVSQESPVSRVLIGELTKYREDIGRLLESKSGTVDFAKIKAEICQRFPNIPLSPLDSH